MAPSPTKRPKMLIFDGESSSNAPNLDLNTPKFEQVLKSSAFVDKSMLIKAIFDDATAKTIIITAPRKCGKTTNMSMVKHFVEIDGTPNLFLNLKISEEKEIMNKHFGKYPVIHADFTHTGDVIATYKKAVEFYKERMRECFQAHSYLLNSGKLSEEDKFSFQDYCDRDKYKKLSEAQVLHGFRHLSELLHRHFDRPCFVLIDAYDSLTSHVMFNVENKLTLKQVIEFNVDMIARVLDNNECVERAMVTGVLAMTGASLSSLSNVSYCRFLEDHQFVDFYGLTEQEVDDLFSKPVFNLSDELQQEARANYGGYVSQSEQKLYNIWSVLNFLQYRKVKNYYKDLGVVDNLESVIRHPSFKFEIATLLQDKSVSLTIFRKFLVKHMVNLKVTMSNPFSNVADPHLFLLFLFENGYFSFAPQTMNNRHAIKVPNQEMREIFVEKLRKSYVALLKFDQGDIYNCIQAFNNLLRADLDIKDKLKKLCNKLEQLCSAFSNNNHLESMPLNAVNLHHLIFFIVCQTQFKCNTENTSLDHRTDLAMVKDDFGVVIQPDFGGNPRAALQLIVDKKYYDVFEDRNFATKTVEKYMLMGVNMNTSKKISMSVLVNSKDTNSGVQDVRSEN